MSPSTSALLSGTPCAATLLTELEIHLGKPWRENGTPESKCVAEFFVYTGAKALFCIHAHFRITNSNIFRRGGAENKMYVKLLQNSTISLEKTENMENSRQIEYGHREFSLSEAYFFRICR